jgi:hypothetical protein
MTVARRGGGGVADGRDPQGRRRGTTGRIAHPSRLISVSCICYLARTFRYAGQSTFSIDETAGE